MAKNAADDALHTDWIRELATILNDTGLSEIEVEKGDLRLRVCRAAPTIAAAPLHAAALAAPPPISAPEPASAEAEPAAGASLVGAVTSPMVGTVYLSPSPDASPFIKVGDQVSEGQTLMIVEAMKTMNPVAAPRAGVIKQIIVHNEQPVEFGEPLLILD